jgi:PKD repeat protein
MQYIKKALKIAIFAVFITTNTTVFAIEAEQSQVLKAIINSANEIEINTEIIFDAKDSFIEEESTNIKYIWDFGDESFAEGQEVSKLYKEPGIYEVKLKIEKDNEIEITNKEIFVYNKMILLISDSKTVKEKKNLYLDYAKNENVYLYFIDSFNSATDFISQEILHKKLATEIDKIQKSKNIIIWTEENAGINALNRLTQLYPNLKPSFDNKSILIIGDIASMDKRRLSFYFSNIKPNKMLVAKESSIFGIISDKENDLRQKFISEGLEYEEINEKTGEIKIRNIISHTINRLINQGVPESVLVILLLFPVIVTILIFLRQIIGLLYPNILYLSLITLAFLVIGLYAGIFIVFLSSITIFLSKKIFRNAGMLYTSKTGIILILVSFLIFLLLIFNNFLELFDNQLLSIAIIPIIFLSTITEQLVKIEYGLNKNIKNTIKLLAICISIYFLLGGQIQVFPYIIQFTKLKEFILLYPELLPFLLIVNLIISKWTGLRVLERIRFRKLLRNID